MALSPADRRRVALRLLESVEHPTPADGGEAEAESWLRREAADA